MGRQAFRGSGSTRGHWAAARTHWEAPLAFLEKKHLLWLWSLEEKQVEYELISGLSLYKTLRGKIQLRSEWSTISALYLRPWESMFTPRTAMSQSAARAPSQSAMCTSPMTSSFRTMCDKESWRGLDVSSKPGESPWTPSTSLVRTSEALQLQIDIKLKKIFFFCAELISLHCPCIWRHGCHSWGCPVWEPGVCEAAGVSRSRHPPEGRGGLDPTAHGLQRRLPTHRTVSQTLSCYIRSQGYVSV